ncbi:MAG: hypothetical protein IPH32_07730 [Bacteroidetes bacterium]|nr:hypothetical protein [Bacteroidota bacterium]
MRREKNIQLDGEKQQQEIVLSEFNNKKRIKRRIRKKKRDAENLQIAIKRLVKQR